MVAVESDDRNPVCVGVLVGWLPLIDRIGHEELGARVRARLVVRTGEVTPCANVLLRRGVPFGGPRPVVAALS